MNTERAIAPLQFLPPPPPSPGPLPITPTSTTFKHTTKLMHNHLRVDSIVGVVALLWTCMLPKAIREARTAATGAVAVLSHDASCHETAQFFKNWHLQYQDFSRGYTCWSCQHIRHRVANVCWIERQRDTQTTYFADSATIAGVNRARFER